MNNILLTIICLIFTMINHETTTTKVTQLIPIQHHITSLNSELADNVQYIYWQGPDLKIETTVVSNLNDQYGLDYSYNSGHFDIAADLTDAHTLTLRSKKVNTQIFIKGQMQKTRQQHKVFVPAHLSVTEQ